MSRSASRVPPDKWKPVRIEKVNELYDLLAASPEGLFGSDIAETLQVSTSTARRVVRDLRVTLGVDDVITVITEQQGSSSEPHLYRLVGTYEQARGWVTGRVDDVETRLETIGYTTASLVRGSDGRTLEGRKARYIDLTIRHLLEQLALMKSADDPTLF